MTLAPHEYTALCELVDDLRHRFGATDVRLFGSAARGTLDRESDVDLLVVVPSLTWELERAICDRCYETTLACGRLFSPSIFTVDDVTHSPLRSSPFVRAALREGVVL